MLHRICENKKLPLSTEIFNEIHDYNIVYAQLYVRNNYRIILIKKMPRYYNISVYNCYYHTVFIFIDLLKTELKKKNWIV
jgi:hypothetical protein